MRFALVLQHSQSWLRAACEQCAYGSEIVVDSAQYLGHPSCSKRCEWHIFCGHFIKELVLIRELLLWSQVPFVLVFWRFYTPNPLLFCRKLVTSHLQNVFNEDLDIWRYKNDIPRFITVSLCRELFFNRSGIGWHFLVLINPGKILLSVVMMMVISECLVTIYFFDGQKVTCTTWTLRGTSNTLIRQKHGHHDIPWPLPPNSITGNGRSSGIFLFNNFLPNILQTAKAERQMVNRRLEEITGLGKSSIHFQSEEVIFWWGNES